MRILFLILLYSFTTAQIDKDGSAKHYYACAVISIGVSEIVDQTTNLQGLSPWIGFLAGVTANELKENIWDDKMHRGVKTLNDRLVGFMGAASGALFDRAWMDMRSRRERKRLIKIRNSKELLS